MADPNTPEVVDPAAQADVIGSLSAPGPVTGGDLPPTGTPFTDLATTAATPTTGPFTTLASTGPVPTPNRYSPAQTGTTAALASLAQQGLNSTADQRLSTLVGLNQAALQDGNEKRIRMQLATAQRAAEQAALVNAQQTVISTPATGGFEDTSLKDLLHLQIANDAKPLDQDTLETAGVARLQSLGAQDPSTAALYSDLQKNGDVLSRLRDNVTKLQLFSRELDALRTAHANQGVVNDIHDFMSSFLPFKDFFSRVGNFDGKTGFFDLPSTIQNKEIFSFWNQPLDKFKEDLPGTFEKFSKQSFGLGSDLSKALEVAHQFGGQGLNNSDALTFNAWTAFDIASFVPLDRMALVPSKAARLLGNRVASADIAASALASEIHGFQTGLDGIEAPYHAVEESLPSSLVPDTASFVRPDVGIAGDVADRLRAIREAGLAARRAISGVDRLAPEQVQEAVERAVKEAQLAYRDDPIADLKAEPFRPDDNPFAGTPFADNPAVAQRSEDLDIGKGQEYVVARKMPDGTIRYGKKGDVHPDLIDDHELEGAGSEDIPRQMGFAKPGGPFLTRDETSAALGRPGRAESVRLQEGEPGPFGKKNIDYSPRMMLDPEADLDNLSYINARGEVYNIEAPEGGEIGGIREQLPLTKDADTGIYSLNFYLGKRYSSGGFLTRDGAVAAATRRGLALDQVGIHQTADGTWYVKVRQAVTETGISNPVLKEADFPDLGYLPVMSRAVKSADNIMPEMFNRARIGQTVGKSKFLSTSVKPLVDNIARLNKKSLRALSKVLSVGERDQKWFTLKELEFHFERASGHLPSRKEVMAYYSAKELSDVNYHIFNNQLYADKARRGVITVSMRNEALGIDTGRVNGSLVQKVDFTKHPRIFDLDEGRTLFNTDSEELDRKLATGNYRVIDLEKDIGKPGDDLIKTVLAHNSSSTIEPLERDQLNYVEGGSRENRFRWFVKQANSGLFKDGSKFWKNPITHVAAPTRRSAEEWATKMEAARLAYLDKEMPEAQRRAIFDRSPVESPEKFEQMMADGSISSEHPFEALFDRQTPTAMSHIGEKDARWFEPALSSAENYTLSKGRMYYSKKGDHLVDPTGEYAETLDPLTTLHNAMQNAAQTFAFSDYNKKVIDEWARVATPYLDRNSIGGNHDSYTAFFHGKLADDFARANPSFYNQLEATRQTHMRLMGMHSEEQRWTYTAARRFADWVENKGGKVGQSLALKALDRASSDPVQAVRGMVFDAKLGFFDPGQLIIQTQTAFASMSAHPLYGARTAAMIPVMSHILVNRSEALLDRYANLLKGIHGLEPSDFKDMVTNLRNSGWLDVGGEVAQLDQYMNRMGGSALHRGFNGIRTAGRWPFNMSEKFNRLTAYSIAWQVVRDAHPDATVGREFISLVNKKADDLSMNMTQSSAAFWQKGPLSIPTQFLAYQARVLENILPKTFGGSARFTGAQKARLAIGQLLMYGAAGVPAGLEISDWAAKAYADANDGKQLDPDTWRVLTKGFWDSMLYHLSGGKLDTDFAHRGGQGAAWTDFIRKFYDGDGPVSSVLSVAGGPAGASFGNMADTIEKFAAYAQAEQFGMLSSDDFELMGADLTQQISSLNRAEKAWWLYKTGTLRDPKSGETIVRPDRLATMAVALGIPLRQETERWDIIRDASARQAAVRDMAKLIAVNRRNAFQAMWDGDDKKQAYYSKLASGLLQNYHYDPLLQQDISKEADHQLGYSEDDWNALVAKTYEHTGRMPNGGR